MQLKCPLFTDWTEQYVTLTLPDASPGRPIELRVDGETVPFQYTGEEDDGGAEIVLLLGFDRDQTRTLKWVKAAESSTDLSRRGIPLTGGAVIGSEANPLRIPAPKVTEEGVRGPISGFSGRATTGHIDCPAKFEDASLAAVNDGPLFRDYELTYCFADHREYILRFRCYLKAPYVEVSERFSLRMDSELVWTLNPHSKFDRIISHRGPEFQGESQPDVEPLGEERPRDVLCRLQMPVLNAYFIPNNRRWFAFFDSQNEDAGMMGILGLYGERWMRPVKNMPEVLDREASVEWHASLESGSRHWLLYDGPVQKEYTRHRRFVFHRLNCEFNRLPLGEQLDLDGETIFDESGWDRPGLFEEGDFRAEARRRIEALEPLQRMRDRRLGDEQDVPGGVIGATFCHLVEPGEATRQALYDQIVGRMHKWVRQWQGYRTGEDDYQKSTIGFSRRLRGLLIAYELLRREDELSEEQVKKLNSYFCFAARVIQDEDWWPFSRTWKHPDHPESARDFYTYGGEHKPDRLVWTNSLPNFQSDPMCSLAHLSAIFPDHPDAEAWRRKALDDLERQLDAYCGESGAWEESINYALYTLSYFIITFRVMKNRLGIDYFNDRRMRRYVGWLCRFFGPYDERFGVHTWPAIGNSKLPQMGGDNMLAYAAELPEDDPLREQCIAIYQKQADALEPYEHYPTVLSAMAPVPEEGCELDRCTSEHMDEIGVAMRHRHLEEDESYLFQKIGFWKDHYENDETAFNWYARGTPLMMDYGTYTSDVAAARAHNLVEIPDMDALRRGYVADHMFSPALDYTHSEMPVTLKLLWGRVRSWEEIDGKQVHREETPYHYIGDENPVGPKTWKVRLLMFVKPDYIALFDRVYGDVPHRLNFHATADELRVDGPRLHAEGRFDLDLEGLVQHPAEFEVETGELIPDVEGDEGLPHRQAFARLYNREDGIYRTLLFAKERDREVDLEPFAGSGIRVRTRGYTDYVFLHNETVEVEQAGVAFTGRSGWIRRREDGAVQASIVDGERIGAFGTEITGQGPWTYNLEGSEEIVLKDGPPRPVEVLRG